MINIDRYSKALIEIATSRERERIIKLLKEIQKTALNTKTETGTITAWAIQNAMVLIKKDNK